MLKIRSFSRLAFVVAFANSGAAWAAPPAEEGNAEAGQETEASDIIVTGTRFSGMSAAESAAPIKVLGEDTLQHVGQPNIAQALNQLVPSFVAQQYGSGPANLTPSAALRGLSPNQTLILLNGKRRHGTSNFQVLNSGYQGSVAPDIDLISSASIKRIEVLEDGAAAQYGSDAIAGVVNIILKDADDGGSVSATAGQYFKGDGLQYAASANIGTPLGERGYLNLTGFYRKHEHSTNAGLDSRVSNPDGTLRTDLTPAQRTAYLAMPDYPYVGKSAFGDPKSTLVTVSYNAAYDLGGAELYSFGTYGKRNAEARQGALLPDLTIASPVLGVRGTFGDPGILVFYPLGSVPKEVSRENDFGVTTGIRGESSGWGWDISTTYGRDKLKLYTMNSANRSLFVDTHFTPSDFYDGFFKSTEWTNNIDITKEVGIGLASPLRVAFGGEYRWNSYQIGQGDAASIYKEGPAAFPGFQPSDAGTHSRSNIAAYLDVALEPVENLKLDAAVRYEHYSDFGSKVTEKLTGRYDFSPAFALRGTIATGFRAPSLAEQWYSSTVVSPLFATVQLPANSDAAKVVGFQNLKPETSTNFSFGAVIRPADRLTITLDAYQISIKNRILATGTIFGRGGANNSPAVLAAIAAHGNILEASVTSVGVTAFTNGLDTRTRGIDLTASYMTPVGDKGRIDWTLAANYNTKDITEIDPTPAEIGNQTLFNRTALGNVTTISPRAKVIGGVAWSDGPLSATLRETYFGKAYVFNSPNNGNFVKNIVKPSFITDVELNYNIASAVTLSVGANNLFNKKPEGIKIDPVTGRVSNGLSIYAFPLIFSPYGINGGYYYGRISVTW